MNNFLLALVIIIGIGLGFGYSMLTYQKKGESPSINDSAIQNDQANEQSNKKNAGHPEVGNSNSLHCAEELSQFLQTIQFKDYQKGTKTITGIVVDEAGNAVVGASIVAEIARPLSKSGKLNKSIAGPLEEYLSQEVAFYNRVQSLLSRATSDFKGNFTLNGIHEDTAYWLSAKAAGYCFVEPIKMTHYSGQKKVFTAQDAATVNFQVISSTGQEVKGGSITCFNKTNRSRSSTKFYVARWTSAEPVIQIPVGFQYMRFKSDTGIKSKEMVTNLRARQIASRNISLLPTMGIYGKINTCENLIADDVILHISKLSEHEINNGIESANKANSKIFLFGRKSFALPLEKAGSYLIRPGIYGEPFYDSKIIELTTEMAQVNFTLPSLKREKFVLADVKGPNNELLTRCQFHIHIQFLEDIEEILECKSKQRADGKFIVRIPETVLYASQKQAEAQSIQLLCTSPIHGRQSFPIDLDSKPTANLQFSPPATVEITIDSQLAPSLRNSLTIEVKQNSWRTKLKQKIGNCKTILFAPYTPGNATLIVSSSNKTLAHTIATQQHELHAGHNQISLEMPELYDLVVQFPPEYQSTTVRLDLAKKNQLTHSLNYLRQKKIQSSGKVFFRNLKPTQYELQLNNYSKRIIDIEDHATVDFNKLDRKAR